MDMALCLNHNCPLSYCCYRYQAPPHPYRQSYGDFKYDENGCEYYIDIEEVE